MSFSSPPPVGESPLYFKVGGAAEGHIPVALSLEMYPDFPPATSLLDLRH